ncbi:MAG: response regulator [Balneola sp.]
MLAKKLEINKKDENLSSKFNIVLIDQNEMLLDLLDHELTKHKGFSVIRTSNGVELLNKEDLEPDLILMDMIMEGVNGIELIKKIRSEDRFAKIKIIILSEKLNESIVEELKSLSVNDVIQKPANIGEVIFRVERSLKHQI